MGHRARLPGTTSADRIVCHVDMDCFYAACERLREPALCGQPVVVGMGYEPGEDAGAVATASYEAREYGVESAQAITTALEHLPRKIDVAKDDDHAVEDAGFYRPVDMEYYETVAEDVREILHDHADVVREVSIDEAYLDVTDRTGWEGVAGFAASLKREIRDQVGVTASVGVAPTMSAAKVASDHEKPDGLVVVEPGEVSEFFRPLSVEAVHGVGPVTAAELEEMGIETAGDLAAADPARLESRFGERGRRVARFARGEDDRTVEPRGKPKSFSRESAFGAATADPDRQRDRLLTLAEAVAGRANRRDVLYRTISIKVVTPPFEIHTRAESLPGPVADPALVADVAENLFEEFEGQRVRKLGVRLSNLSFADGAQPTLGEWADNRTDSQSGSGEDVLGETGVDRAGSAEERREEGQRSLREFE